MQVTGKALVLDEIINYVQSLQNQVEVIKPNGKNKREKDVKEHLMLNLTFSFLSVADQITLM